MPVMKRAFTIFVIIFQTGIEFLLQRLKLFSNFLFSDRVEFVHRQEPLRVLERVGRSSLRPLPDPERRLPRVRLRRTGQICEELKGNFKGKICF